MNVRMLALTDAAGGSEDPKAVAVVLLLVATAIIWPILFMLLKESIQMQKKRRSHRKLAGTVIEISLYPADEAAAGRDGPEEWIVFEDEAGRKYQFQNEKRTKILLLPGDEGLLEIRGERVCGFQEKTRGG